MCSGAAAEELSRIVGRTALTVAEWLLGLHGGPLRRDLPELQAGGAQVLYENLYCACGDMENRIKEQQPFRRPDADRDPARQRLCFAAFASGRGEESASPAPETTGRRRFGRSCSRRPSASAGSCLLLRRPWQKLSVRGEPAGGSSGAVRGSDTPLPKAEPPTTVRLRAPFPGVGANRKYSPFIRSGTSGSPTEPGFWTASRSINCACIPDPASGLELMRAKDFRQNKLSPLSSPKRSYRQSLPRNGIRMARSASQDLGRWGRSPQGRAQPNRRRTSTDPRAEEQRWREAARPPHCDRPGTGSQPGRKRPRLQASRPAGDRVQRPSIVPCVQP